MRHPPYKACQTCARLPECQLIGFREGHQRLLANVRAMCERMLKSDTVLDTARLSSALGFSEELPLLEAEVRRLRSWGARCLIRLRFDQKKQRTLEEAASWLRISRKRARQLEWKALRVLRHQIVHTEEKAQELLRALDEGIA